MDQYEFGRYLKELRENRKLSTRQVEAFSGVSNGYISQIENGKRGIPKPKILEKLAPVYRVSYEELMIKSGYWATDQEQILNDIIPEIDEFSKRLAALPKEKRDELLKIGNQLFEMLTKDGDKK